MVRYAMLLRQGLGEYGGLSFDPHDGLCFLCIFLLGLLGWPLEVEGGGRSVGEGEGLARAGRLLLSLLAVEPTVTAGRLEEGEEQSAAQFDEVSTGALQKPSPQHRWFVPSL